MDSQTLLFFGMTLLDTLKLFVPPLLSALVAFMLFYMTTKRDRKKDKEKSSAESLNKVKHFNYVAKEAITLVDKQANAIREHITLVESNLFEAVPIGVCNKRSCELLVDLISSEGVFNSFTKVSLKIGTDVVETFSKVSARGVYINHQLESILKGVEDNIDYIHSQTKLIQVGIDELLQSINTLSLLIQKKGFDIQEDKDFVEGTKSIDEKLYSQKSQGLETFYTHLVLPLKDLVIHCRVKNFANIDSLLAVARARDRVNRMYNELFGSRETYKLTLGEEATKLQAECDNLKSLVILLEPMEAKTKK